MSTWLSRCCWHEAPSSPSEPHLYPNDPTYVITRKVWHSLSRWSSQRTGQTCKCPGVMPATSLEVSGSRDDARGVCRMPARAWRTTCLCEDTYVVNIPCRLHLSLEQLTANVVIKVCTALHDVDGPASPAKRQLDWVSLTPLARNRITSSCGTIVSVCIVWPCKQSTTGCAIESCADWFKRVLALISDECQFFLHVAKGLATIGLFPDECQPWLSLTSVSVSCSGWCDECLHCVCLTSVSVFHLDWWCLCLQLSITNRVAASLLTLASVALINCCCLFHSCVRHGGSSMGCDYHRGRRARGGAREAVDMGYSSRASFSFATEEVFKAFMKACAGVGCTSGWRVGGLRGISPTSENAAECLEGLSA